MKYKLLLFLILFFAFFTRFFRLDYPTTFVFDEVYNAFTTIEFTKGNIDAYEWFHTSPTIGTAYGWTHPPLAKLIDASGTFIFGNNSFGWRVINAGLGVGIIFLIDLIANTLFPNKKNIALLSSFIASLDGLLLVQSRINMNDIVFVFFALLTFFAFIKKTKLIILGICLGLTLVTKWTGIYLLMVIGALLITAELKSLSPKKSFYLFFCLFIIPFAIYLLSYSQYFLLGGSWDNFVELQRQMWWYNTNLKATHDYGSAWWSWPFNLYPIWYFVEYQGDKIANIFASGNPIIFWGGFLAIIFCIFDYIKTKSKNLLIIILGYLIFWLPWAFSPRIMFLYHYTPSVPFLSLALGYQMIKLKSRPIIFWGIIILMIISFILYYPFLTGILLPKQWIKFFFMTNLSKNPF